MKKWITLMSLVCLLTLAACTNKDKEKEQTTNESTSAEENWKVENEDKHQKELDKDIKKVKQFADENKTIEGVKGAKFFYDHTEGDYRIISVKIEMEDRDSTVATFAINTKTDEVLNITYTPLSEQIAAN
ncbi:hypothetical protein CN918_26360 [Priestia megaterium]|nr:hypothetical protein CN918_26360 [Priestia megaterium]